MFVLCRNCGDLTEAKRMPERCSACSSPRLFTHGELSTLSIAHIDCDAFYASVEKRDKPDLATKPVIVGGGQRGVVSACCYIARLKGVHSAMPMFQARKLCPDAVIIKPNMEKYSRVGREIRELMQETTPLVEPLSIDEAFLDLSGTEKLHGAVPAQTLVRLVRRIETEIGVDASVGLSYNKFLAKTASDLNKPRGFAVIGKVEAIDFLSPRPVGSIWGVGKSLQAKLRRDGISTIGQLRQIEPEKLISRYGAIGSRLSKLSRGMDSRAVDPTGNAKSISAETTFSRDISTADALAYRLWPLCEKVTRRLKAKGLAGCAISLKLKTSGFKILTRSRQLSEPTQIAEVLYREVLPLLKKEADGTKFRLIGIGVTKFDDESLADQGNLLDGSAKGLAKVEAAMDKVREKFGSPSIRKGRAYLGD
jgi:DNA polymerase-4